MVLNIVHVLLALEKIVNKQEETLGGDSYGYGHDSGDGFMDIYLSPNSSCCRHKACIALRKGRKRSRERGERVRVKRERGRKGGGEGRNLSCGSL